MASSFAKERAPRTAGQVDGPPHWVAGRKRLGWASLYRRQDSFGTRQPLGRPSLPDSIKKFSSSPSPPPASILPKNRGKKKKPKTQACYRVKIPALLLSLLRSFYSWHTRLPAVLPSARDPWKDDLADLMGLVGWTGVTSFALHPCAASYAPALLPILSSL